MAESTKDLVAKRDMQLRMFDGMEKNKKTKGNLPNKKDNARQAKLNKNSSPEGARKAGKKKFFEMYEGDGRTPKKKEKEMKGMKKMNMGGMTAPSGMDAAAMMAMKKKKRKPMMPAQQAMDGGAAMPMMKKGGKVRGAGMAKKGVRACKMR